MKEFSIVLRQFEGKVNTVNIAQWSTSKVRRSRRAASSAISIFLGMHLMESLPTRSS
jgi:hypothetical protein